MKNLLFTILTILLFCHCTDNSKTKEKGSNPEDVAFHIVSATANAYKNLQAKDLVLSPIARLCSESKGYRKDEWDALNECSWAVEKYQMDLHPNQASRSGGELTLIVADSTLTLTHREDEYYQFVELLPVSKHIVIRVLRPLACPEYWLIEMASGQKKILPGEPVFTADRQSFLLSSSTANPNIQCPNELTYWTLKEGDFQQVGVHENKKGIQDLMWYNGNIWLGKQGEEIVEISI